MTRIRLLLGCGLALWVAPSAQGAVSITAEDGPRSGHYLLAKDNSKSANEVTVSFDAGSASWLIADQAGIAAVTPECTLLAATQARCGAATFDIVIIDLGDGNDSLRAEGFYAAQGPGSGPLVDILGVLGKGRDRFEGGEGSNSAVGGPGPDRLIGGNELDNLFGGRGADRLVGRGGSDFLVGGAGNDKLAAGGGKKGLMIGGRGKDRCIAGHRRNRVGGCERVGIK